jgi:hypothetical protein
MALIMFGVSILLIVGIGLFLIVGTIKGIKILVDPPTNWFSFYPYVWLKKIGNRSIYYFHIFIGAVFIICGICILFYAISY